ncbi:MAG: CsgG/HfaB family protein [Candidatus Zixiibacteriota bacterium]
MLSKHPLYKIIFFLVAPLLILSLPVIVTAQDEVTISNRLGEAITYYTDLEFDKGIAVANELLASGDLESKDSIAVYAVLSLLTFGKGESFAKESFSLLDKMANIGPCKIHLPYEFWPQQLRDHWYKILRARDMMICPEEGDGRIKTIAIMEFDNYSVGKFQEELGFITKGLADFFEADFAKISDLKVVERDKIEYILKELELSKSGMVETSTAVRVGKMLGAQMMVFGSITQLDKNNSKMLIKAVKVETSEIVATVEREGKPDYFAMQKELVKELAEKLDIELNEKTINLLNESGTASYDAATLYSRGLYYMDKYDYKQAYEFFRQAYEKDNTFTEAKRKMDIYRPLALG